MWCPLNTLFLFPGVYEVVLKSSPIVWFDSLWGTVLPQNVSLKTWDCVLSSGNCLQGLLPASQFYLFHGEYIPCIWHVHGSGPVCQASPYWKPSRWPLFQGKFTSVAWLIAAHAFHSWMVCAMASMVRSIPQWWAHLSVAADVSWPHQVINSSPFHSQSKCT